MKAHKNHSVSVFWNLTTNRASLELQSLLSQFFFSKFELPNWGCVAYLWVQLIQGLLWSTNNNRVPTWSVSLTIFIVKKNPIFFMVSKAENNLSLLNTFNEPFQPTITRQSEDWNSRLFLWESGVNYPRVSLSFHPLTKKPLGSGYCMRLMQILSTIMKYFDYEMYIHETKNLPVENSTGKGIDCRQSKRSYHYKN